MAGIIDEGKEITILHGYYDCDLIKKGDVVAYNYAGNNNPIIKTVLGLPKDDFKITQFRDTAEYLLLINGQPLANSNGQPYRLDREEAKMLQLYEKDYRGKIPPETYLILGNITSGSLDSIKFGLVGEKDILGKVIY